MGRLLDSLREPREEDAHLRHCIDQIALMAQYLFYGAGEECEVVADGPDQWRVNTRHNLALHLGCGRVWEWNDPSTFCPGCYNARCDRCSAPIFDPYVVTGDYDDTKSICNGCWDEFLSSD